MPASEIRQIMEYHQQTKTVSKFAKQTSLLYSYWYTDTY